MYWDHDLEPKPGLMVLTKFDFVIDKKSMWVNGQNSMINCAGLYYVCSSVDGPLFKANGIKKSVAYIDKREKSF